MIRLSIVFYKCNSNSQIYSYKCEYITYNYKKKKMKNALLNINMYLDKLII